MMIELQEEPEEPAGCMWNCVRRGNLVQFLDKVSLPSLA